MSTCEPSLAMPVRSFLATVAAGKTHGVGGELAQRSHAYLDRFNIYLHTGSFIL